MKRKATDYVSDVDMAGSGKQMSRFGLAMRRFCRNRAAVVSLIFVIILVLAVIFADHITPYEYDAQDLSNRLQHSSWEHLMGTDNFGRDTLTRILRGGRISLFVASIAGVLSILGALILGAISGYYGGSVDNVIMRICDIFTSIPGLIMAMTMSAALGSGLLNTAIAISVSSIWGMVRLLRASILTIKDAEYVEAAKAFGAKDWQVIYRHIIPHCLAPLIVQAAMSFGGSINSIASLSFLGLGVQPPTPEWGNMLSAGKEYITTFWPMIFWPGLMIGLCLLAFNQIGNGLRDALDPRMKR